MSLLPTTCTSASTSTCTATPKSSSRSGQCQRRYPRLVSNLFWLYLLVEGLCFVVDVAFLSTTVMAARSGGLNMTTTTTTTTTTTSTSSTTGRYLQADVADDDKQDDDQAYWNSLTEADIDTNELDMAEQDSTTTVTLDWATLQTVLMEHFKLQWKQQQAFLDTWLGSNKEATK